MSWTILFGIVLVLGFLTAVAFSRRAELGRMERSVRDRDEALRNGSRALQLQHPLVDLSRCMGCATCVAVCPETGVLDLVHGQAVVVNGAGCMGVSACERECPVGAITVTIANAEERRDIPAFDEQLEAVGAPGVFLAGEVTALAQITVAIDHGVAVGAEVARRVATMGPAPADTFDLVIVGAGPAGLACALEAKRNGLSFCVIDQATDWGGTVAKYPRRKLVMTQPVDLPLHGRIDKQTFSKEELMALWLGIAEREQLPLWGGQVFGGLEHRLDGNFAIVCGDQQVVARHVCLAIGRRGSPRKLGVPGEELGKVAHSLVDAGSFQGRRVLVVGGGDSAVETACALATQPGNQVALSYRKNAFIRIRSRNKVHLEQEVARGRIQLFLDSDVTEIAPEHVDLDVRGPLGSEAVRLENDEVFVMIGGVAPTQVLEASGVSLDPSLRLPAATQEPGDDGLRSALKIAGLLLLLAATFVSWHGDYYFLSDDQRPAHAKHALLRPGLGLGLWLGIGALAAVATNLAYLLRRSSRFKLSFGSIRSWMTLHVVTGIVAVVLALLHASLRPGDTVGGHSLWMLVGLLGTGAVGRYFYAWVPRAANGRELRIEELRERAHQLPDAWDGAQREFGEAACNEVLELIQNRQWKSTFFGRLLALVGIQRDLRRAMDAIERRGLRDRVPHHVVVESQQLAREAHRQAIVASHFEDLRALASTWRYLHRWGAVLMVVLVLLHVAHSLIYGNYFGGGGA